VSNWMKETGQYVWKYHSWPNPFRNAVKRIDVLACEDTWQAMVEMYFDAFGFWFWSSFVPSPVELTRKTLTGSYKCGFYLKTRFRSPLDIVWRDGRTSQMLMEVLRPVATGLFYIWAAETTLEAMSTWSSITYAMERCDLENNECLLRDGLSPMPQGLHSGNSAFMSVIYDPQGWAVPNDGAIDCGESFHVTAHAVGYFETNGHGIEGAKISLYNGTEIVAEKEYGHIEAGDVFAWSIEYDGPVTNNVLAPYYTADVTPSPVIPAAFICTRFTVKNHAVIA